MGFLNELKRRNVFKIAAIYAITGWLLIQVASIIFPEFGAPEWALRIFIFVTLLGFPLALILAWALELTPEGLQRTEASVGEKRMWTITAILVVLVLGWYQFGGTRTDTPGPEAVSDQPPVDSRVSIAVLPFLDLSAERDQEYFALGMSEELLNVLAKIDGLQVASRTSAFAFQGSELGAQAIGKSLGVGHVLEGSIRKAGNRLRITAQLIDVDTDRHLWSETYDRELADVFDIQDEITRAIVESLRGPLGIDPENVAVSADTEDFDAYRLFLEGRELFIMRDVAASIERLERSVEIDPEFARSWEQLAAAYAVAPSWIRNDRPYAELSVTAAERAIELDPDLSMAYAALSNAATTGGPGKIDWDLSFEYIDKAIENDPNNATAHLWRGIYLAQLGYMEEAIKATQRCIDIDPGYNNCYRHLSWTHATLGDFDTAVELAVTAMERGFFGEDEMTMAMIFLKTGNRPAALLFADRTGDYFDLGFPDWFQVVENPAAYPERKRQLVERIRKLLAKDSRQYELSLNIMLVLLGHPGDVRLSGNEFLFAIAPLADYDYLGTAAFQDHVRQLNLDDYWDEHGPPPQCRKLGEHYECSRP